MSMRMNELLNLRLRLRDYVKGWTAHALLKQSLTGEDTVSIGEFEVVMDKLNESGAKITLSEVIKRIVEISNARDALLPWSVDGSGDRKQKVVIHCGGQVFRVDISQKKSDLGTDNYLIDIKKELSPDMSPVGEESLVKFHKPGIEGGETKITFDGAAYTIHSESGLVIKDTAFPPRPLQLNAVRAFAKAINKGNPTELLQEESYSQLALLGTGTGKSFIIASVAEAVGSSVIVLPTAELAGDMLNDAMKKKIFSGSMGESELSFMVNGVAQKVLSHYAQVPAGQDPRPPFVVLAEDINSPDIFQALMARGDVHIILNANGEDYKNFLPLINNSLLLIDESHQHAYTEEQAEGLRDLSKRNVAYALTGTPTGPLFDVFETGACVEFNLHDAMDAYLMRKLEGEDRRLPPETDGLVDAAVLALFKPVYLHSDDPGYVPAAVPTIASVQANLMPPCPKAMVFSDDHVIRENIQRTLTAIEEGVLPAEKLDHYAVAIRESRMSELAKQLQQSKPVIAYSRADLEDAVPPVNLHDELANSRLEAIKNTVFSFALSQLFKGEDREKFASLLRSNSIASYPWGGSRPVALGDDADLMTSDLIAKIDRLTEFKDIIPAVLQEELKKMIKEVTLGMAHMIQAKQPPAGTLTDVAQYLNSQSDKIKTQCSTMLLTHKPADIVSVDQTTPNDEARAGLASLRYGLSSMSLSDERWATGVSVEDVLTSVVVTSRLDFESHNSVAAPLGAAQAVGRAVRAKDLRGSTTMIVSTEVPESLVFSVRQILAKDSGDQSKSVLKAWDKARAAFTTTYEETMRAAGDSIPVGALEFLKKDAYKAAYEAALEVARALSREEGMAAEGVVRGSDAAASPCPVPPGRVSSVGLFKHPEERDSPSDSKPSSTPDSGLR